MKRKKEMKGKDDYKKKIHVRKQTNDWHRQKYIDIQRQRLRI